MRFSFWRLMSTWTKTRGRHLTIIRGVDEEPLPKTLHITNNGKTGVSVDFPPHRTCTPTAVCMGEGKESASCYALSGFMTYSQTVRYHARNLRLVNHLETASYSEVRAVAANLWQQLPRGRNWIRWNGAGDLVPGACRLINAFTRYHPDILVWVTTRKPEMVQLLRDRASLFLTLSLDKSTPTKVGIRLRAQAERFVLGQAKLSYTRVSEADTPPPDVWVVFNKHVGGHRYAWKHKRVCPATLPDVPHENACENCRHCFGGLNRRPRVHLPSDD